MHGTLQNRNKMIIILIIVLQGLFLYGCNETDVNTPKENSTTEIVTEVEDINMEKKSEDEELVTTITELLECEKKSAQYIYNTLDENINEKIISITKEEGKIRARLIIIDNAGNRYVAIIASSNDVVEEIYCNDEKGERIYFIVY